MEDEDVVPGDTILVRGGPQRIYQELVTTKGLSKVLHFRPYDQDRPKIVWPEGLVVEPGSKLRHFVLEFGGSIQDFDFVGPGTATDFTSSGIAIFNPSDISGCRITDYGIGFLGFCAANSIDNPSRFARNIVERNGIGIDSGDKERIYEYNVVCGNDLGVHLVTGSQARVLNNLICSNTSHGIKLDGFMSGWASTTEIANNNIGYHHPIETDVQPTVGINRGLSPEGQLGVRLTLRSQPGDAVTLMTTDRLGGKANAVRPVNSYELSAGEIDVWILGEVPDEDRRRAEYAHGSWKIAVASRPCSVAMNSGAWPLGRFGFRFLPHVRTGPSPCMASR